MPSNASITNLFVCKVVFGYGLFLNVQLVEDGPQGLELFSLLSLTRIGEELHQEVAHCRLLQAAVVAVEDGLDEGNNMLRLGLSKLLPTSKL